MATSGTSKSFILAYVDGIECSSLISLKTILSSWSGSHSHLSIQQRQRTEWAQRLRSSLLLDRSLYMTGKDMVCCGKLVQHWMHHPCLSIKSYFYSLGGQIFKGI